MWPQLLVLAASAFLKYQNDKAADNRRKSFANAMEAFQRGKAKQTEEATEGLLKKQTPEARGTELADLTGARERSLRDTVGAAQAFDAPVAAGKQSGDFARTQEAQAQSVSERTKRAIEQLARMGAPGEQQRAHQLRFGRAAGVVDASNSASENVGRRYMTDISNVRANPFLNLVSQIGMGWALGGAGGAATAGATGAAANNGQGYEDSSGNLYNENTTNANQSAQDARIRRQMQQQRAFSLWGQEATQ